MSKSSIKTTLFVVTTIFQQGATRAGAIFSNSTDSDDSDSFATKHSNTANAQAGFSLIELIIVITILVILAGIFAMFNVPRFINHARDAERRADFEEYRLVFEEYFNDHKRYPPQDIMDDRTDCSTDNLAPYLNSINCDPSTGDPYLYFVSEDGQDYWLYTFLRFEYDTGTASVDCKQDDCYEDGMYNYVISSKQLNKADEMSTDPEVPEDEPIQVYPPYCGGTCDPGLCGVCCPGAKTRCADNGTGCYSDPSCE